MNKIPFRYLNIGEKHVVNGLEYIKTNRGRSFRLVKGKTEFIKVKKNKLVETEATKFDVEGTKQ